MPGHMNAAPLSQRQARLLLRFGLALFLAALLVGVAVPRFAVPRLGLSVHLLGILQGLFLLAVGLLWPKLSLGPATSRVAFWCATGGCLSAWSANLLAAVLGAGNSMLPLAAGQAHGGPMQEQIIALLLRLGAVALVTAVVLLLWGLRGSAGTPKG
jgi:hydroxylaminobenzene mutase